MLGLRFDEVMVGTHRFTGNDMDQGDHPFHFSLTWGHKNLLKFLNPFSREFLVSEARGVITVGGLVDKADCRGRLRMLYFSEGKIRYELTFKDHRETPFRYVGEKRHIRPWNLHKTHFTCYGKVTNLNTGEVVSTSVVYFPYRETIPFLLSFRLTWGGVYNHT